MVSCEDSCITSSYVIKPPLTTFICDGNVFLQLIYYIITYGDRCID